MKSRYALLTLSLVSNLSLGETISDACFNCPDLTTVADKATFVDSTYYANVIEAISNGYAGSEIKNQLMLTLKESHTQLTYSEVWTALTETDEDPNNSSNVLLLYKGTSIGKFSNGSGSQSSDQDNWNREHVWAKSHGFPSSSTEAYSDIHHLRPTDISVNASRGNLDFDLSDNPLAEAPVNRVDGDSFEPRDQVKGDVARMLFYMDTRYEGQDITPDLELVDHITSTGEAKLGKLCRLIEWHNSDPVDSVEINRNSRIYEFQGNRNPFIDHPEWVDLFYSSQGCNDTLPDPEPDPTPDPEPDPEPTPAGSNVFISEYVEGSSNNKAIELFNASNVTVDLAEQVYVLSRYSNGSASSTDIYLTGTIAPNTTFVIAHTSADSVVKDIANQLSGALSHNGDDAYVLFKDDVAVDSFGRVGEDPGSQWGADDVKTKDNSLQRIPSVLVGDANYSDAFDPAIEWLGSSQNDFSNLGVHTIVSPSLFISEYIEGSSYNKAIELFNPSSVAVDLSAENYTLERYSNGSSSGSVISLDGIVEAGDVFVIAEPRANADILAQADQTSGQISHNGDDAYILFHNREIVDSFGRVGEDPGSQWGSDTYKTKDNTLIRSALVSSGDTNPYDAFNPSVEWEGLSKDDSDNLGSHLASDNSEEPISALGFCFDDATLISSIQGSGEFSPVVNETHVIEGIVSAVFPELQGFFVQEELVDQDSDPTSSEGLFIDAQSAAELPNVGSVVRVIGSVKEHYENTQLSVSEDALICGNDSVTATPLSLPVQHDNELEAYEGMLVSLAQTMTVVDNYNLSRFGEFTVATERLYNPTQIASPGEAALQVQSENRLKRLLIDDGSSAQNPELIPYPAPEFSANNSLRVGSSVANLEGVIMYSYSSYRLQPTIYPNFIDTNPRMPAPDMGEPADIKIASFNVLNYFNGDGQGGGFPTERGADTEEEYIRQKEKLIQALLAMGADIIGLLEVENDGFDELSAIQDLVNGLNAYSSENLWAFVNLNAPQIGTDKITSAIIYRTDKVTEVGAATYTTEEPFDYGNRPPILQSFQDRITKDTFGVVVTHLRSKGSCSSATGADEDLGDGQGCWNATRVNAVNNLLAWLDNNLPSEANGDVIVLGDMNAYGMEDPIEAFKTKGLSNLTQEFHGNRVHSYIYQGESGSLDHVFASASMKSKVKSVATWHINTDEPRALDYNMEYKSDYQLSNFYAADAYRTSDHDPILIGLDMTLVGDWDGDNDVDVFDMRSLIVAIQQGSEINNSFDLNRDSTINMLDVRALRNICTRRGCAP